MGDSHSVFLTSHTYLQMYAWVVTDHLRINSKAVSYHYITIYLIIFRGNLSPLIKITVHFWRTQPPKCLRWLCYTVCIDLAFKVFSIAMINFALLRGYWDNSNCWLCTTSIQLYHHTCIFENMSVVTSRPHQKCGRGSWVYTDALIERVKE